MKKILIFILLMISAFYMSAQVLSETALKEELKKRNIDESKFRQELLNRGIDINKIDPNKPEEIFKVESEIKKVLNDLQQQETEKYKTELDEANKTIKNKEQEIENQVNNKVQQNNIPAKQASEIENSIKKGATVKEAVTESIIDAQKETIPEPLTYGQHLFRNNSLKIYRTADDSKPTKNYILGAGDVVAISIYGQSSMNFAKEISKDGYIQPDRLPRYYIAGLSIEQAEKLLKNGLKRFITFGAEEFQIAVTTARTVNVNIHGEVFNNGSFNISALNNAFNALVASGGPTNIGSVRKIKLLRNGEKPRILDIYKFMSDPSSAEMYYLQENDYIHVPIAEKLVTVYGAVNRPFRYELLENENLNDLVKYAGGLLPNAIKRNIQLTRFENDKQRIIDINLTDLIGKNSDFLLQNGDIIKVNSLKEDFNNFVTIRGAVEEEGKYAFIDGMKLTDLVERSKLRENSIQDLAYLYRLNDDLFTGRYEVVNILSALQNPKSEANILLKKGDVIILRNKADFVETNVVSISGSVRIPGSYSLNDNSLKVSDLLFLSGGLNDNAAAFGYLFRQKPNNPKTFEYVYLDLKTIIENKNSKENIVLNPKDSIFIYYASDFIDKTYVKIDGAVRNPSEFLYNPTLTVKDVVLMAGGLKKESSPNRIDIYRLEISADKKTSTLAARLDIYDDENLARASEFLLQPNDLIYVRFAPEYELQRTVLVEGELLYPGRYALLKENTKLSDIIDQAGGVTQEAYLEGATLMRNQNRLGYVVINLKEAMKDKKSFQNLILQDEDVINIPKQNTIVSIIGATNYNELYPDKLVANGKINIAFESGHDAMYYINHYAGGVQEEGDKNRITVEHKNGRVEKVKNFLFFKKYPKIKEGSVVKVPYKRKKTEEEKKENKDIEWGDVLKDSIAQATAILSLILLIRSVD